MRSVLLAILVLGVLVRPVRAEEEISVTVLVMVATEKNSVVEEKLKTLCESIKAKEPKLTGLTLAQTHNEKIKIGGSKEIDLGNEKKFIVTIVQKKDSDKVTLKVRPPVGGEISYTCNCGAYLPVCTGITNANGDRIIVAVMAKPCTIK